MFDNDNVISVYTRQQAILDGVFIDVTEVSKGVGFRIPIAMTTNLYSKYFKYNDPQMLRNFLFTLALQIKKNKQNDMLCTKINIGTEVIDVWAVVEATSPTDPSPCMNVLLPEDF